jgi:hypothetical protein
LFLAGGANRAQSRQQTRRDCGNNLRPIKAVVNDLTNAFGKQPFNANLKCSELDNQSGRKSVGWWGLTAFRWGICSAVIHNPQKPRELVTRLSPFHATEERNLACRLRLWTQGCGTATFEILANTRNRLGQPCSFSHGRDQRPGSPSGPDWRLYLQVLRSGRQRRPFVHGTERPPPQWLQDSRAIGKRIECSIGRFGNTESHTDEHHDCCGNSYPGDQCHSAGIVLATLSAGAILAIVVQELVADLLACPRAQRQRELTA